MYANISNIGILKLVTRLSYFKVVELLWQIAAL